MYQGWIKLGLPRLGGVGAGVANACVVDDISFLLVVGLFFVDVFGACGRGLSGGVRTRWDEVSRGEGF